MSAATSMAGRATCVAQHEAEPDRDDGEGPPAETSASVALDGIEVGCDQDATDRDRDDAQ